MAAKADERINVRGKSITTFIAYEAAGTLKRMKQGQVLEVIADASEPIRNDLEAWTRAVGHRLLDVEQDDGFARYFIERGYPKENNRNLAMVVSNPGLEELLSPLAFALAAALEGAEVHIYFQGPAVRVLTRDFRAHLPGLRRIFSPFARRGMEKTGHIAPQDKLRQLRELGAHFYACGGSMDHYRVRKEDFLFDDVPVVEYLTFMEVMAGTCAQMYV